MSFGEPDDSIKWYVTFLHEEPTDEQRATLRAAREAEAFEVGDREVYSELDKAALGDGRFTTPERSSEWGRRAGTGPSSLRCWS